MSGYVVRGNASKLPLPDESVDLIITSPPYFALRSYRDSGEHYTGQIGSEPTPQEWLEALWACMAEWWRVLKPTGSVFVNLGDKRAGSGAPGTTSGFSASSTLQGNGHIGGGPKFKTLQRPQGQRSEIKGGYNQAAFGRAKSKMSLPHRFFEGCMDGRGSPCVCGHFEAQHRPWEGRGYCYECNCWGFRGIGWIARQDIVWQKLNGLPESVTDRHRDSHEFIFHLTKQERYFAAMDEIRTELAPKTLTHRGNGKAWGNEDNPDNNWSEPGIRQPDSRGALPGSVWPMASEPLIIPAWAREKFNLPDHFAAFPSELPRKLILAFSSSGICVECGQGRRPVVDRKPMEIQPSARRLAAQANGEQSRTATGGTMTSPAEATITGYACACTPVNGICPRCHLPTLQWLHDRTNTTAVRVVREPDNSQPHQRHVGAPSSPEPQSLLLEDVLLAGQRSEPAPPSQNDQGLYPDPPPPKSDGRQAGLRDGTPISDGAEDRPPVGVERSGSSPERGQGRQPTGEPRTSDQIGSRSLAEYEESEDQVSVSPLRARDLVCRCEPPPTRPSLILDPFSGTGTVPMVAKQLGRIGIGIDLSADYCRLAQWRIAHPPSKVMERTWGERQGSLL